MDFQDFVYLAGDLILLTAIPALVLFVTFYFFKSPWRKEPVGRSLMYFALALLVTVAVVAASVWLGPEYFGREWVRLISYVMISVTTWRLFVTLRTIQKKRPDPEPDDNVDTVSTTEDSYVKGD